VLDVDTAQRRLSLGLKASYFDGAGDAEEAVDGKAEVQLHVLWLLSCFCHYHLT